MQHIRAENGYGSWQMQEACVLYALCMEALSAQQSSESPQTEPRHSEIKKQTLVWLQALELS